MMCPHCIAAVVGSTLASVPAIKFIATKYLTRGQIGRPPLVDRTKETENGG